MKSSRVGVFLVTLAVVCLPRQTGAQLDLGGAVKRGAEYEANRQAQKLGRDAVRCAVDNLKCIKKAEKKGKEVVLVDENGNPVADPNESSDKPPGLSSATNSPSDFESGSRVIFKEDFATTAIGSLPPELEEIQGQVGVIEWNGQNYLRNEESLSRMALALPEILPESFTLEFDLFEGTEGGEGVSIALVEPTRFDPDWMKDYDNDYLNIGHQSTVGLWGPGGEEIATTEESRAANGIVPIKVMVQADRIKMYVGERKVAETSRAALGRSDRIYFFLDSVPPENLTYVGNIRIAAIE